MVEVQRHVHYERTPFMRKLFYVGIGAALYWFAFAGGCEKAKAFYMHTRETSHAVKRSCGSYNAHLCKSIDDKIK